jgi:hypothetical protein
VEPRKYFVHVKSGAGDMTVKTNVTGFSDHPRIGKLEEPSKANSADGRMDKVKINFG